jgi:hypothetical protein
MEERGDLGFVRIADYEADPWEGGDFFGSTLGITAGYENARGGIGRVDFAYGVAGLGVSGGGDRAGVENYDVGGSRIRGKTAALLAELAFDSRPVGLSGAAAELLDKKGAHGKSRQNLI